MKKILELNPRHEKDQEFLNGTFLGLKDGLYNIYFTTSRPLRSLSQLRYYWGVIVKEIANQTGNEPDEIHDLHKQLFGIKKSILVADVEFIMVTGLRKMSKQTATEFIERVLRYWAEKGILIPDPHNLTEELLIEAYNTTIEHE